MKGQNRTDTCTCLYIYLKNVTVIDEDEYFLYHLLIADRYRNKKEK